MLNLNDWTIAAGMAGTIAAGVGAIVKGRGVLKRRSVVRTELLRSAEVQAYEDLDPALAPREAPRALARRVCATVAEHSAFQQVAMFLRDADSRLHVAGSAGVDHLSALEIGGKVARFARDRRRRCTPAERECREPMTLNIRAEDGIEGPSGKEADGRQVIVLPLWSHTGEMLGALALWRRVTDQQTAAEVEEAAAKELLGPVGELAERLGRSIDLNRMSARLLGSKRLARLVRISRS